ncbi:hypothetical protein G6F63_015749 [Rhizopus arrhizus]|nr:hypothetical protein G6F63_015749 [Rhizopus arrhizus]
MNTSWSSISARTTKTTPKPWTSPATRRWARARSAIRRPRKELRLPLGQGHPAARDLGPADGQALDRRPHRPARRLRVQPHQPQVQGVPGAPARRQGGLRVRAAS